MDAKEINRENPDWYIHLCANGVACECCGEIEDGFRELMCNAHTHGLERYNHPDFQMVVQYPAEAIGYVLNEFGYRVRSGERFSNGEIVEGIFTDCPVRLEEAVEMDRTVFRIVIPDGENRWPEDPECEYPYSAQGLRTEELYIKKGEIEK
ncbi:MAG: DUF4262 domain-containing protein [Clostridiales bacterium]|nr:DUF4262 domain-containing protein [Clostridiales bacterium]